MALLMASTNAWAGYVSTSGYEGGGGNMPLMVFLIGVAHAIPILFIGFKTKKRWALYLTTAVMTIIAVMTGGIVYLGIDLLFIGLAFYIVWVETRRIN
jgi:hypothetical protein